ncbi:uncharacterized protein LOC131205917 [Anopheles bellator]|uniref:uncharacterized protein LOC131205917 n=1 Tax=Anopheles bellator TaxID=139047 RepID=UPI00264784D2|nr:uncharacterized protein LOC131205917 [Anopheles bellator]
MNLNGLPDEVLCQIFDKLDVYELKLASRVCRRWAELTFSGRRMNRVWLVKRDGNFDFLFNTKRNYRNIRQWGGKDDQFASLVRLLHTPTPIVRMLVLECTLTSEHLRLLLLEAPELQHLSFSCITDSCEMNGPFPVLAKLTSLSIDGINDRIDLFRRSVPNLQSLYMFCGTDLELDAWKYLSRQLKLVHVHSFRRKYVYPFLEITFPLFEDLAMGLYIFIETERSHDFFQRHPFLRKLSIRFAIPLEWVESIARHCSELKHLHLFLDHPVEGYLESLAQLTKLTHLSLEGEVGEKIFRRAIKSLEFVELFVKYPRPLSENLFEIAPRLNGLKLKIVDSDFYAIEFICKMFSCLQNLEVGIREEEAEIVAMRFERFMYLEEMELRRNYGIHYTQHSNVRCLTLVGFQQPDDDDLNKIPEMFPSLKRLIIGQGYPPGVFRSVLERIHKLMPSCRIDYGDERFYPIDNSTSN